MTFDGYDIINGLRTTKQVNEHSFLFPLVQEVLKFTRKHKSYGQK